MRLHGNTLRLLTAVFATNILLGSVFGAEMKRFDAGQFARDQDTGKSVIIDAVAEWCPTCKAQKVVIDELLKDEKYRELVVYRLDFDTQRGELGRLGSQFQSTLIAFSGRTETARSIGDTDPQSIRSLFDSAVK